MKHESTLKTGLRILGQPIRLALCWPVIVILSACSGHNRIPPEPVLPGSDPPVAGKYLGAVQHYADTVLAHARDAYGTPSPLIVDTLYTNSKQPYVRRISASRSLNTGHPQEQITFNLSLYQPFFVTMRELSRLSGDPAYFQAARETVSYALQHCKSQNHLLYWGNHTAWDVLHDVPVGGKGQELAPGNGGAWHEIQGTYADYGGMHQIDPSSVENFLMQHWTAHLRTDPRLVWGRHGSYATPFASPFTETWAEQITKDPTVPFVSAPWGSWGNAGFELIRSGLYYWQLTGNEHAHSLADQMLRNFMHARDSGTKLALAQYYYLDNDSSAGRIRAQRMRGIWRTHEEAAALLALSRVLPDPEGSTLRAYGFETLDAFVDYLHIPGSIYYREGMRIDATDYEYDAPTPELIIWSLALGYRLSGNEKYWDTARDLLKQYGLGDIGTPNGEERALNWGPLALRDYINDPELQVLWVNNENAYFLHALIELYTATQDPVLLNYASHVADALLQEQYRQGLFLRGPHSLLARTTAELTPLALVHLEAAIQGMELHPAAIMPRRLYFRATFEDLHNQEDYPDLQVAGRQAGTDFFLFFRQGQVDIESGQPPVAPSQLTQVNGSLSWSHVENASGYVIARRLPSDPGHFEQVARLEAKTTTWSDTGYATGSEYHVRAYNAHGYSPYAVMR